MKDSHPIEGSGCGCCRRDFLGAVGTVAGGIALSYTSLAVAGEIEKAAAAKAKETATVRAVFLYPPSEKLRGGWWSWPGMDFDAEGRQAAYTKRLKEIEQKLAIRIAVDKTSLDLKESVTKFIGEVKQSKPDGLLLIPFYNGAFGHLDHILKEVGAKVSKEGKVTERGIPTVVFSSLGVKHGPVKQFQRPGVYFIQSLDNLDAVEYGIRMIKTAWLMRHSRIISLAGSAEPREGVVPHLGTRVRFLPLKRFLDEFNRTEITDAVKELARGYMKNAKKILEPAEPEIIAAARVHFANKRILQAEQGDAIMMDCLRRGELMPCMSYMSLRDEGIPAGCENDLGATLTLMLIQHLFERPGFLANPAFETEKNHFFASHCTCASKLFGPARPPEPYLLRNYAHTNDPTCVPQVLWREGEDVTMAHYVVGTTPQMLVYSGKVVKSYAMPPVGGCRTNVEITINELDDVCDVKGHHNILFYGSRAKQLRQFARLCGIRATV